MGQHTKATMSVPQLLLRAAGVALASVLMFVLLAALGSSTAEAAPRPAGLGDLLGPDSPAGGPTGAVTEPVADLLTPIVDPVRPLVAPPPATPPVTPPGRPPVTPPVVPVLTPIIGSIPPVVTPAGPENTVADAVRPIVDTVGRPAGDIVAPVADAIGPPAGTVVTPVTDTIEPPAGDTTPVSDTIEPVVEVVPPVTDIVTPGTSGVRPPAIDPVPPDVLPVAPGAATQVPPIDSLPPLAPIAPIEIDSAATATAVEAVETDKSAVRLLEPAAAAPDPGTAAAESSVAGRDVVNLDHFVSMTASSGAMSSSPPTRSATTDPFPRSTGPADAPSVVSGLLSSASSSSPAPGEPSTMFAVLAATAAAMFWMSRRVTAEVSWRSAVVLSSIARPG